MVNAISGTIFVFITFQILTVYSTAHLQIQRHIATEHAGLKRNTTFSHLLSSERQVLVKAPANGHIHGNKVQLKQNLRKKKHADKIIFPSSIQNEEKNTIQFTKTKRQITTKEPAIVKKVLLSNTFKHNKTLQKILSELDGITSTTQKLTTTSESIDLEDESEDMNYFIDLETPPSGPQVLNLAFPTECDEVIDEKSTNKPIQFRKKRRCQIHGDSREFNDKLKILAMAANQKDVYLQIDLPSKMNGVPVLLTKNNPKEGFSFTVLPLQSRPAAKVNKPKSEKEGKKKNKIKGKPDICLEQVGAEEEEEEEEQEGEEEAEGEEEVEEDEESATQEPTTEEPTTHKKRLNLKKNTRTRKPLKEDD